MFSLLINILRPGKHNSMFRPSKQWRIINSWLYFLVASVGLYYRNTAFQGTYSFGCWGVVQLGGLELGSPGSVPSQIEFPCIAKKNTWLIFLVTLYCSTKVNSTVFWVQLSLCCIFFYHHRRQHSKVRGEGGGIDVKAILGMFSEIENCVWLISFFFL